MKFSRKFLVAVLFCILPFAGCSNGTPSPTATPRATATPVFTPTPTATPVPLKPSHVIVISIDGLRPDALAQANTPNIDRLISGGSATMTAQTILPSETTAGHASMFSGVDPKAHGVVQENPTDYLTIPTVFSLAEGKGISSAIIAGKKKLFFLARPESVKIYQAEDLPSGNIAVAASAAIESGQAKLIFIHFADVDLIGHSHGWMSELQIETVEQVDSAVGIVMQAISRAKLNNSVVILTSDHGGFNYDHGGNIPEDMTIPWIIYGKYISVGLTIKEPINVMDTGATILDLFDIPIPGNWRGKPVRQAYITSLR